MKHAGRAAYIAGPMRGRADYHFPEFFAAGAALSAAGWAVFNPARMDVIAEGWPSKEALEGTQPRHRKGLRTDINTIDAEFSPATCRKYARRDVRVLFDYLQAERDDAVILLPGWERSVGARAERANAEWVGLRILSLAQAL